MSRYYDEINEDIVRYKNRLHKALQQTFPELETVLSRPDGKLYWHLVQTFPHPEFVHAFSDEDLIQIIKQACGRNESFNRLEKIVSKLKKVAYLAYPAVDIISYENEHVIFLAKEIEKLTARKGKIIDDMVDKAYKLPEFAILESIPGIGELTAVRLIGELGDVRRFRTSNKLNAFIGLDIHQYQSGDKDLHLGISKRGNPIARKILFRAIATIATTANYHPCHIADFYNTRKALDLRYLTEKKKQSPESIKINTKKTTISAMNRLIRTIHHLIITGQSYDYTVASGKRN